MVSLLYFLKIIFLNNTYLLIFNDSFDFQAASPSSIYDFTAKDIDGNDVSLSKYAGHVCIIVNVASKWGKTAVNYKQLVALQKEVSYCCFVVSIVFSVQILYCFIKQT